MIYICIPAHNEQQTVGVVLWKIRQVMAEFPRDYQLLVVDDASTDRTAEVLAPYARVLPLTVVRTETRQGEGAATEMMLREAVRRSQYPKRDVIITLQADFTQEPDDLVTLIKRAEAGADIVVGQAEPDPTVPRRVRWARWAALRLLRRGRLPEGVTDPFTGYRAYRVFAVRRALEERGGRLMHWSGWAGAAELLLATAPHARRVDTVNVRLRRERLQRPSRLDAWTSLKAVWSLAREAKPQVVATPAELDRAMQAVAAERASEVAARQPAGDRRRSQRGETRPGPAEPSRRGGPRRERGPARAAVGGEAGNSQREQRAQADKSERSDRRKRRERPGSERPERSERRERERAAGREAGERAVAAARTERAERPERMEVGERQEQAQPVQAEAETAVQALAGESAQLPLEALLDALAAPTGAEAPRRKRKRPRRRKRSAGCEEMAAEGSAEAGAELVIEGLEPVLAADVAGAEEPGGVAAEAEAGETEPVNGSAAPRKRRRGRRGGRRRSGAAAAAAAAAAEAGAGGEFEPAGGDQDVESRPAEMRPAETRPAEVAASLPPATVPPPPARVQQEATSAEARTSPGMFREGEPSGG